MKNDIIYDKALAKHYSMYFGQKINYYFLQIQKILYYLNANDFSDLLDVGCGSGRIMKPLSRHVNSITGIEKSIYMYNECLEDLPKNCFIINDDFLNVPIDTLGLFRGIYFSMSLHQIRNETKVFTKCYELLDDEGRLLIITVSREQFESILLNKYFPSVNKIDFERFLPIPDLVNLLKCHNFEIESIENHIVYQTMSLDKFVDMLEHKYISSLQLISEEELKEGIHHIKETYTTDSICVPDCYTYVVGKKIG